MHLFKHKDNSNEANREANRDIKAEPIEGIILEYIQENPKISQKDIAIKAGVSRATIQRTMKTMMDKGVVTRSGTTRGYWKITK